MMLTVIRIRIYAIVVVISAVDAIAATAARDRKDHRVNQDRRVYREHPVRRAPPGLRDYKASLGLRGRLDLRAYRAKPDRRGPLNVIKIRKYHYIRTDMSIKHICFFMQ
ncbi:hypothetical protein ABHA35_12555, partial [[Clostridium] symbiosum]